MQSDFVREMFLAWDAHAAQIPALYYFRLTDWSQAVVDAQCPSAPLPFKEFLRTLGVRSYAGPGTDKIAYATLDAEAAARGW